ncbi:MAG: NAD-dependent protein deacylase [Deltaproteobacteria bacterium]|nr:NAD-dependent protein deacylase [Deltaproteobacteria bacterium]
MTPRRPKPPTQAGNRQLLEAVAVLLHKANSALFITGPGLSHDSGLSNYRGISGLRRKKPEDDKIFEAALSAEMIKRKPELTWKYLLRMEEQVKAAQPNRAHEVLVKLERQIARTTIMTINIDRLHQRAGSHNVIEMHGAMFDLLCSSCELSTHHENFDALDIPPKCKTCGTVLRPDMPLFGEALPVDPFTRLQQELDLGFDIVFAIGCPTMFPYLARPILLARAAGLPAVEIGETRSEVSDVVDFRFKATTDSVMGAIWDIYTTLGPRDLPTTTRAE